MLLDRDPLLTSTASAPPASPFVAPAEPAAFRAPAVEPDPQPAPLHRALRRLRGSPAGLASALAVAGAANALTWGLRPRVGRAWTAFFAFWIERLGLEGRVSPPPPSAEWVAAAQPLVEVTPAPVDPARWWALLAVTAAALVGTRWLPDRCLPVRYLIRFAALIQGSALAFLAAAPGAFPYTLTDYAQSMLQSAVWLLLVVPWLHALTYGIFGFSLARKAALTVLTVGFLAVGVPFLVMTHLYAAAALSVAVLPVLFFLGGTPVLILACIGLYGWAMSWERGTAPPGGDPVRADDGR